MLFLGNPEAEKHAGEGSQTGLVDVQTPGQRADFDEPSGTEVIDFAQLFQVVGDGNPGLQNGCILQHVEQGADVTELQNLKHIHPAGHGQLNQRGRIGYAALEGRPGLGVKPEQGFLAQGGDRIREILAPVDQKGLSLI